MTPEERAKSVTLNDDNGLCCFRAMGGICHEHAQLAGAIRAAIAEGRDRVLVWLGRWRDVIPAKAVGHLQDILEVPEAAE